MSGSNISADLEEVRGSSCTQARRWVLPALLVLCCEGVLGMCPLARACLLSLPPLGAGVVRAGCWWEPGCPVPSGDGEHVLLSPGLRAGT